MRRMQNFIVTGKHIFVGLEDSKRSWKVCVRSGQVFLKPANKRQESATPVLQPGGGFSHRFCSNRQEESYSIHKTPCCNSPIE